MLGAAPFEQAVCNARAFVYIGRWLSELLLVLSPSSHRGHAHSNFALNTAHLIYIPYYVDEESGLQGEQRDKRRDGVYWYHEHDSYDLSREKSK